ncbi:MAG: hypothetical protein H7138_15365, partial [Myxococcales bacterium]|nr:hypothetical protein [Myxococcales bacterium]
TGAARALGDWHGLRSVSATRSGEVIALVDGSRQLHLIRPDVEPEDFPGEIDFAGFATDTQLVIAAANGVIDVYNVADRRRELLVTGRSRLLGVAWGRGHHPWIAAAFSDGTLWRKNLVTGTSANIARSPRIDPARPTVRDSKLLVSADGTVTFLHDQTVHAWSANGQLARLATAPKPLDDLGEAGTGAVIVFASDSTTYTLGRDPPSALTEALPALDATSAAMSPDTGLLVALEHGAIEVLDPSAKQHWTLAQPTGVTFDNLALSADGRRVVAGTPRGLVTWTISLPASAIATAAWLETMTNAVDDGQPGLGWR